MRGRGGGTIFQTGNQPRSLYMYNKSLDKYKLQVLRGVTAISYPVRTVITVVEVQGPSKMKY